MTVAELIRELQVLDPNTLVVLAKDAEGNGYSPLELVDIGQTYRPYSSWSGELLNAEDIESGDVTIRPTDVQAVCLLPAN